MAHLTGSINTVNCLDATYSDDIARDIREGLTASQKYIPCKYLYDARGSKLFEEICLLPEYYPTRTEVAILEEIAPELMRPYIPRDLIELGSGADRKIRIMLDAAGEAVRSVMRYIPVDISESAITESSLNLIDIYPEMEIIGVIGDFTCRIEGIPSDRPRLFCFLGGTIGNLDEQESINFLKNISTHMRGDDTLLIGFDMVKPIETVEVAYNDAQGITAEFNRNVLNVINNELGADFDPSHFDHLAFFNIDRSRIEMHLRANRDVWVRLESIGMEVEFEEDETIHTENSRKFTRGSIEHMANQAHLSIQNSYTDPKGWFSLLEMRCRDRR
ncbi:L-histidine N(alpha)-methyltransferase [Chloroflexota bacterium]